MSLVQPKNGSKWWCGGCGNHSILASYKHALSSLNIESHKTVLVSGIGCAGKISQEVDSYSVQCIHGRALPLAIGLKVGRPDLTVVAVSGDGDAFSIGLGHFLHAARRNVDITYIVLDNERLSLTNGQKSPTSVNAGQSTFDPEIVALAAGIKFVQTCRKGSFDEVSLTIKQALQYRGFSTVILKSKCVFSD